MELTVEDIANELVANTQDMTLVQQAVLEKTAELQEQLSNLRAIDSNLRIALKDAMEANDVKKFENDYISFTYKKPYERRGLDTSRLKADHPELVQEYEKVTTVNSSVVIKLKETK